MEAGDCVACCAGCCEPCIRFMIKTPFEGAQTSLYCALDDGVAGQSGRYYVNCKEAKPHARARSEEDARRLWELSEDMVGLGKENRGGKNTEEVETV